LDLECPKEALFCSVFLRRLVAAAVAVVVNVVAVVVLEVCFGEEA